MCDVGTAQYDNETIKYKEKEKKKKKKKKEQPNVTKV